MDRARRSAGWRPDWHTALWGGGILMPKGELRNTIFGHRTAAQHSADIATADRELPLWDTGNLCLTRILSGFACEKLRYTRTGCRPSRFVFRGIGVSNLLA
jgi:hypothetical protein